jgi:hypothetical protein
MFNDKTETELGNMQKRLWDRSPAPRLTVEQLNAIDLLILGKTDRETADLVGVRRETITKWHQNPFFIAELNTKRDALWIDSKLRLKALAHEAVNVLTNGLHSTNEKIAITAAVHILKTVGLYDTEGKASMDLPKTPEEAVWAQLWDKKTNVYRGSRPDALDSFSTKQWAKEVGAQLAAKTLYVEYEEAVRDQKKELRESKKREKLQEDQSQLPQIELTPAIEEGEDDLSQGQGDGLEPIEA